MSPVKNSAWVAAQNVEVKRRRKRAIGITVIYFVYSLRVALSHKHVIYAKL